MSGWNLATPQPPVLTVFVNEVNYKVQIIFGTAVGMSDTTGDGAADIVHVDVTGDGISNTAGVPMDTTGDGAADAVGIDTTGDGLVDAYIDLMAGNTTAPFPARVLLQPDGSLQVSFPVACKGTVSLEVLMDVVEAWGEAAAASQADALRWSTDHDFEVVSASIGKLTLTSSPLMIDASGNGFADQQETLWMMPPGAPELAAALADVDFALEIKVKISVTQAAPRRRLELDDCEWSCCAVS